MTALEYDTSRDYKYWAFISYSHKDERWGAWLHKSLEKYRVPRHLVARDSLHGKIPKRLFPVFRDRVELPSSSSLTDEIKESLKKSRFVVVICTPESAVSRWVNEEVKFFKSLDRENRVLCLLANGEPYASDDPNSGLLEAFPRAVRFKVGPDEQLTDVRAEPLAADVRKGGDGKHNARLKIIAGILGVGYDELKRRDKRRKRRTQLLSVTLGAAIILFATFLWMRVVMERARVVRTNAILSAANESHDPLLSALLIAELAGEPEPFGGLAAALHVWDTRIPTVVFRGQKDPIFSAKFSTDGSAAPSVTSADFSPDGQQVVTASEDLTARVWNTNGKGNQIILRGHKDVVRSATFSPDGTRILTTSDDATVRVWHVEGTEQPLVLSGHEGRARDSGV